MRNNNKIYISLFISLLIHIFLIFIAISFFNKNSLNIEKEKIIKLKIIKQSPFLNNLQKQENTNTQVEYNKNILQQNLKEQSISKKIENIKDFNQIQSTPPTLFQKENHEKKERKEMFGEKDFNQLSQINQEYLEENYNKIVKIINKNLLYPSISGRLGHQGTVYIKFDYTIDGEVKNIKIEKSSGYKELDYNAVETIEYSKKEFKKPIENINIKLKINYKL